MVAGDQTIPINAVSTQSDFQLNDRDLFEALTGEKDLETWTRYDSRAKTFRMTNSAGPKADSIVGRITRDKSGAALSVERTKRLSDRELYRSLGFVGAITTTLLFRPEPKPDVFLACNSVESKT